ATVYGIVKQSGGHIIVESEVGHGAKFAVYLPAMSSAIAPPPERSSRHGQEVETLLVVEKEVAVRSLISDVLRRRGYQLLIAEDEAEALRLADGHGSPIHLLIAGASAALNNGAELAESVRERRPETRVLLLQKPFTPESLARRVRAALEEAGQ